MKRFSFFFEVPYKAQIPKAASTVGRVLRTGYNSFVMDEAQDRANYLKFQNVSGITFERIEPNANVPSL